MRNSAGQSSKFRKPVVVPVITAEYFTRVLRPIIRWNGQKSPAGHLCPLGATDHVFANKKTAVNSSMLQLFGLALVLRLRATREPILVRRPSGLILGVE